MVVDVISVHVVEVSAVQVVRMTDVLDGGVTASWTVLVAPVVLMLGAIHVRPAFHL